MKKLSALLMLISLLVLLEPAAAQDDYEDVIKDYLEVVGSFGVNIPSGALSDWESPAGIKVGAKTGFGFGGDIGYFLTTNMVLGIHFTYVQYSIDSEVDLPGLNHRFYNPSLYFKYYFFGESNWAPFLKAEIGVDNPKFTTQVQEDGTGRFKYRELSYDPVLSFGGSAGLFRYTSDYSGVFVEANVHYGLSDKSEGTYQSSTYEFGEKSLLIQLQGGIKVFFGPGE